MQKEISYSNIFSLAWPAVFSFLGSSLIGFIDLLFVGRFGPIDIAAISLANLFFAITSTFLDGLRTGTSIFISKYLGSKEDLKVAETIKISFLTTMLVSIFLLLVSFPLAKLCYFFVKNPEIAKEGIVYLTLRFVAAPLYLFVFWSNGVFQGWKITKIPMMIMGLVLVLKVIGNYIFLSWHYRLDGIAMSTVLAYFIASFVYWQILVRNEEIRPFLRFREKFSSLWKEYYSMAWKLGIYASSSLFALIIFFYMIEHMGVIAMAAHQITYQVFLLFYLPSMGFLVSVSVLAARLRGANATSYILPLVQRTLLLGGGIILVIGLFVIFFSHLFIGWICPGNPAVFKLASVTLKLVGISLIFQTFYLVFRGALIALEDNGFILLAGLGCDFLFFLPTAYFFGFSLHFSVIGGYAGYLLWTLVSAMVLGWRFFSLLKKPAFGALDRA
ncbi:MAG: MATE family efflux transporter [Chlamydiota bacterium]